MRSSAFVRWRLPRERLVLLRLLAVFVLLWSCGTQERFFPRASISTHSRQAPSSPASDALATQIQVIAHEIAALRGWKDGLSVAYEYADLSRVRQALAADMHAQTPTVVLHDQTLFLASLGLVPRDFNLENAILDAFAPEVLGIYSLTWGKILVVNDAQPSAAESVLRHEVVHAFQDQLFHLKERTIWGPNRGDEVAALHALSEGEAVCIARELEDPEHQGCIARNDSAEDRIFEREIPGLPSMIRYSLFAPYVDGIQLVKRLLRQGGWRRVDEAWLNGVHSTRALFRDTTGTAADLPTLDPPHANCIPEFTDVLGEQGLTSVLYGGNSLSAARKSASLLASDRATYWRCGALCTVAWQLRTVTEQGATSLASDLGQVLGVARNVGEPAGVERAPLAADHISLFLNLRDIEITSVHNCDLDPLDIASASLHLELWPTDHSL